MPFVYTVHFLKIEVVKWNVFLIIYNQPYDFSQHTILAYKMKKALVKHKFHLPYPPILWKTLLMLSCSFQFELKLSDTGHFSTGQSTGHHDTDKWTAFKVSPSPNLLTKCCIQRAKKVLSDSPGLVDFAIWLVIFVLNLPDRQVLFFGGNSDYRRIVINRANQKGFRG